MTDGDLVRAALEGDDEAFGEIVRRYEPAVAATVMGMLGDCPEAEDVGQEVFVRLYRSLASFRGEASLRTYLTRIAINLSLNELKRRKRRRLLFSMKPVEEHRNLPDPAASDRIGEEDLVTAAIQKLDDKSRAVVVLRLIDGHSTGETAGILGVPVGTVLSRLARAQQKLRKILLPLIGDGR